MIIANKALPCPKCQKANSERLIISGDNAKDKKLTAGILDDSLFYFKCRYCNYETFLVYPFLYVDSKKKIMIYLAPNIANNKIMFKKVSDKFPDLKDYKKRLVTTKQDLKEKILIFENGLNDKTVETLKYSIYSELDEITKRSVQHILFCMLDEDTNKISFIIELRNKKKRYYTISQDAYTYTEQQIKNCTFLAEDAKLFTKVNLAFIENIMKQENIAGSTQDTNAQPNAQVVQVADTPPPETEEALQDDSMILNKVGKKIPKDRSKDQFFKNLTEIDVDLLESEPKTTSDDTPVKSSDEVQASDKPEPTDIQTADDTNINKSSPATPDTNTDNSTDTPEEPDIAEAPEA